MLWNTLWCETLVAAQELVVKVVSAVEVVTGGPEAQVAVVVDQATHSVETVHAAVMVGTAKSAARGDQGAQAKAVSQEFRGKSVFLIRILFHLLTLTIFSMGHKI
jgi:hypothetical protein